MATEPLDLDELIEASSLGTPDAQHLRDLSRRANWERLTGVPEEQADWEADGREESGDVR